VTRLQAPETCPLDVNSTMNRSSQLLKLVLIGSFAILGLSGCGLVAGATPAPSGCNGVATDVGRCGSAPSFTATTCEALAAEYGWALDQALLPILRGPADEGGEAKSVRLLHMEAEVTVAMTTRLVEVGLIETCKMPDFLNAAEPRFSGELRSTVGHALFDGQPDVTYQEFLTRLAKVMSGIGQRP
jgi:hypothetical protein